jgi:DNA-binding response OmpR family regulator
MPKNILIVDDDPDLVELLRLALTNAGYKTQSAANGADALRTARRSPPDLVVLDLVLPKLNGFNVCSALREDPATSVVPIIMMTVLPGEFPRLTGMEMGANAYLNKPFQIEEMLTLVRNLLRANRSCRDVVESSQSPSFNVPFLKTSNPRLPRIGKAKYGLSPRRS